MNKQFLRFTLCLLISLILSLAATAQVVNIPDPNLRAAIETALGKASGDTITADEMATLTRLEVPKASIHNLTGLENATNLTELNLESNSISDLSALAGLTKLTRLWLVGNNISDISPVAGLTNLTWLRLWDNNISDISPVAGLTNLTRLWLGVNNISDISPVAGLTNLTALELVGNNISDISPVAGLTNLTWLGLWGNNISDISALAGLTNLIVLYLGSNNISDISALAGLTNLTELEFIGNNISDISALAGLTNLTALELVGNNILDISALAGLTNLTTLQLSGNNISDISALAGLTNLTTLQLSGNNISDISALAGLTNLTALYLRDNSILDISPLAANTGLGSGDTVDVQRNPLSSLSLPIHTHIPTLQSRGVTVEFNDRTHLNVGEPHTVRLIYFLPTDRQSKPDINTKMDTLIKEVQQSYADDMERHGFGRKTFTFETNATGKAVVHHVDGQFTADYYQHETFDKVVGEIDEQFNTLKNIYLVVVDSGYPINGAAGVANGLVALINNIGDLANYVYLASHELRHTFRVTHDFRRDGRGFTFEISKCTAEWLDVHRYFNASRQDQNVSWSRIKMLPPSLASPPNVIHFRFEVTDADGLYQAQLLTNVVQLPAGRAGALIACKRFNGTSSTVEFVTTTLIPQNNVVYLHIIDVHGNFTMSEHYPIDVTSLLLPPEVVSIPDADLAAAVLEFLGLSPGVALTTHTMLNLIALGGSNRQITDLTGLEHAHNLRWLFLNNNNISDISALAGLTNLTWLDLASNNISDISPLVANTGLGSGDTVNVRSNPLSYQSIHTHIPTLQNSGVTVEFDNQAHPALLKISGDNQKGLSFAPLSHPFVVEVQDEKGATSEGVSVTFAVTAGSGIVHPEIAMTDKNGRAESTLILGPDLGTHTVEVSAAGIQGSITFHAVSDGLPTEHLWSIPRGVSLIHVPLKVTTVDGVAQTITSVADLYDALGGADTVNFLITYDPQTQGWLIYFDTADKDTSVDKALTDDTGIIVGMKAPVSLRLRGDALGTNGSSAITLHPGMNLVGVPLRDSRIPRVSDLFALEGNVSTITVADNGQFRTVGQASNAGNIPITGGQSLILTALEAATVPISGDAWYNISETATALPPTTIGIEVEDATPVLVLKGSIGDQGARVHKEGFQVTVKNLSTGKVTTTIIGDENLSSPDKVALNPDLIGGVEYQITIVDTERGRAAGIGDILEISVQSPESLIGVQPLQYTVTAEDVLRSRIQLGELAIYEILWETGLLQNYPNSFTPETWIPYRLAEDAFVILTIYDLSGRVVRTLNVGHRIAAVYESESKAIYWGGRNDVGERVASGIYFYTLTAGDFSATRKMVILK